LVILLPPEKIGYEIDEYDTPDTDSRDSIPRQVVYNDLNERIVNSVLKQFVYKFKPPSLGDSC